MRIIENENIRPFDVDGCLIVDSDKSTETAHVYDGVTQRLIKVGVNKAMVRLLREERHRGSFVIVWSRSGYEWASSVINALNLTDCVDLVMSKPIAYFDDSPVQEWMKDRVFIGPDVSYKGE